MRNQLTEKQHRIYWFISRYQAANDGRSPTILEIRRAFGYRSDNMVLKHLIALKVQGYITSYSSDSHRSIRPTKDAKRSLIQQWSQELMGIPQPEPMQTMRPLDAHEAQRPSIVQLPTIEESIPFDAIVPTELDTMFEE